MRVQDGKLLYHLTTLDVFESIVVNGLLSRNELYRRRLAFVDTANHEILAERERLDLSGCIPFHFHIHTSYDTYVKEQHKDKSFIYLCIHRNYANRNNFYILPIHPTSTEQPQIFNYNEGIEKIDWTTMEMNVIDAQRNFVDARYHKQVRMAECLSPNPIQIDDFHAIIVKDENSRRIVNKIFIKYGVTTNPPYIDVNSKYF